MMVRSIFWSFVLGASIIHLVDIETQLGREDTIRQHERQIRVDQVNSYVELINRQKTTIETQKTTIKTLLDDVAKAKLLMDRASPLITRLGRDLSWCSSVLSATTSVNPQPTVDNKNCVPYHEVMTILPGQCATIGTTIIIP